MELLRKAVDVPALSPGWQQSFRDMLAAHRQQLRSPRRTGMERVSGDYE